MLKIWFRKPGCGSDASTKPELADALTVACPDHLVLADLPVAKGLGSASVNAVTKIVGHISRRQLGDRVHFCLSCYFPIAIYGRLSPCEHALCLDCGRSDSLCFICDERILKIQTVERTGVFKQEGNYPTFRATPGHISSPLSATLFHDREDESQHTQFRDQPPSRSAIHPRIIQLFPEQLAAQTSPLPSPPLLPASGLSHPK